MAATTHLCKVIQTFVCICLYNVYQTYGIDEEGIRLLSEKQLRDMTVEVGDDVTMNCTVTGRPTDGYRITWFVDWTPGDPEDGIKIFAEKNSSVDLTQPGHGKFETQYNRIQNGQNESDAIHICLLKINQVTFNDVGRYKCLYFHPDPLFARDIQFVGGDATLFVTASDRPAPSTTISPTTTNPVVTTIVHGNGGGGSSGSAAVGAVSGVLAVVIVALISIWAGFRYKRYRRDKRAKEIQLPTDLHKVESNHNSYGDVLVNGTTAVNEHNHENPVITDDVPGVRLPPGMLSRAPSASTESSSYSVLNRPDTEIRNQLGDATYAVPPDADDSIYVVSPASRNNSMPSSAARDRNSYETYETPTCPIAEPSNPTLPRRSTSTYPAIPQRRSTAQSSDGINYMEENDLAYMADMSTVYDDVPVPDTQL